MAPSSAERLEARKGIKIITNANSKNVSNIKQSQFVNDVKLKKIKGALNKRQISIKMIMKDFLYIVEYYCISYRI